MPKAQKATMKSSTSSKASDNYLFFWKPDEENGWASQWYPSQFTLEVSFPGSETTESSSSETVKECTFPSAEHYMMFRKALLFKDTSIADLVLSPAYSGTSKSNLAKIKALGREVANFDEQEWQAHRYQIVLDGNLAKFRQDLELKEKLFGTGSRKHVEASPRDRIWGIGYGHVSAANMVDTMDGEGREPEKWGLNLLGKALDETRKILREEDASRNV
ncbi:hypothetical protein V5O48_003114 [Marasmius crinis-equi]|uniref:NADAR domain-containing protein n=1 Tax=Marasmius crinis-equi TaxID=585013 RepID=A0ABR3FUJ2_9AGAR